MDAYTEILFDELQGNGGNLGMMTLNRPAALNALTLNMILRMYDQLKQWEAADHIKGVVIRATEGRAFCAGGDLRFTYDRYVQNADVLQFFRDEYQLNRYIFHYPKPYIAFLDGITMGGGVGISIHGSHRVGTDRLLFAMPETGIGFFPDVGGTYFLPRLPGFFGNYLGLTGARIAQQDCAALNITTHSVHHESLSDVLELLLNTPFGDHAKDEITAIINQHNMPLPTSNIIAHESAINDCFAETTIEGIIEKIMASSDALCRSANEALPKKSPMSLKVTLEALKRDKTLDFDTVMQQELILTSRFLAGHDFIEGIRALIIDKDQRPCWQPKLLADISPQMINAYFQPLPAKFDKKSAV